MWNPLLLHLEYRGCRSDKKVANHQKVRTENAGQCSILISLVQRLRCVLSIRVPVNSGPRVPAQSVLVCFSCKYLKACFRSIADTLRNDVKILVLACKTGMKFTN